MTDKQYTTDELRAEIRKFQAELRTAGYAEKTVYTYSDRANRFLRWLDGDYQVGQSR